VSELADIAAGRVVADDPAKPEAELLDEQDALEFEVGTNYFEDRRFAQLRRREPGLSQPNNSVVILMRRLIKCPKIT
jgi:hypothetical protein